MKRIIALLLVVVMGVSLVGCTPKKNSGGDNGTPGDKTDNLSIILVINGNLGDLGFFDSANEGIKRLKTDYGINAKVIEAGTDQVNWEPALADAAEEDVDIIIAVSPSMVEPIEKIAPSYPDKKFILIDNSVDYSSGKFDNVYCATFKQNEGSFLAGALAAALTTSGMENTNDNKLIGFIGGMDIPPINDFLVGYIEGALFVDPDMKVISTYTGDYYDPAKGKEHGIVLINNGADIIFPAAGPTSLGVIEAAKDNNKYIIGIDSDQSSAYAANGDVETANIIVSSMVKNVGNTIYRAVESHSKGELKYGQSESLGIKEGGVGLAKNDVYNSVLTDDIRAEIEAVQQKVIDGEVKVSTAIGMSSVDLANLKKKVAP